MRFVVAILALLICLPAVYAGDAGELLRRGDELDLKLKTQEALQCYLEADKLQPNDPEILYRIAKEYGLSMNDVYTEAEKKERGLKAVEFAKRAVAANDAHAQAHLALAVSYGRVAPFMDNKTKLNYSKLVKEQAERALALDKTNDLTYHVLGAWNLELADLNPLMRAIASALYGTLPKASFEAALEYFQKAVQLNPNRVANHVELGRTYAALGNKSAARAAFERGLRLPNRDKDDEGMKLIAKDALKDL